MILDTFLIVAVYRSFAKGETRKGELQGGSVPVNHLFRDIQVDSAALIVRVTKRTVWHEKEVQRGESEGVCGGSGYGGANLLQMDGYSEPAIVAEPHTVQMDHVPIVQNTTGTIFLIVPNLWALNQAHCCSL